MQLLAGDPQYGEECYACHGMTGGAVTVVVEVC